MIPEVRAPHVGSGSRVDSMTTNQDLLLHYQRELTYLRKSGAEFAQRYPKIAKRLELGENECADPQVERLLESFAFQTARIQHNLESEFPELSSALLELSYPFFSRPAPSMAIARFELEDGAQGGLEVPRHTPLFTETQEGDACRFLTAYTAELWPLEVAYAGFEAPTKFPETEGLPNVQTVLQLKLVAHGKESFEQMGLKSLRFYLKGFNKLVNNLFELILYESEGIRLRPEDPLDRREARASVAPAGFGEHEDVLPNPPNGHAAYCRLAEYFAFPEKYHFFDLRLEGLEHSRALDVFFLLKRDPRDQALTVSRANFQLGCTPIVNLFRLTADPIHVDQRHSEYRILPDPRNEKTTELHSILSVRRLIQGAGEIQDVQPFYSYRHEPRQGDSRAFWRTRRVYSSREDIHGTETFLSITDLDAPAGDPPVQTVFLETLCTNRDLAYKLNDGAELWFADAPQPCKRISLMGKPTPPVSPFLGGKTPWRLISLLSLNLLSFPDPEARLRALKEVLSLCSFTSLDREAAERQIAGILDIELEYTTRRMGSDAWRGFRRGLRISLTLDEAAYVGGSAFLFASVLEMLFGLSVSLNSFTQLSIKRHKIKGEWHTWPPREGSQAIL